MKVILSGAEPPKGMLAGTLLRLLLLAAIVKATISEGEEKKMRTALAASIAGIHGAILNLSTSQSIRADVGDLFLVFGEYKNVRLLRFLGFGVLEFYLTLAGLITIGPIAYYTVIASNSVIPIKFVVSRRRAYRLKIASFSVSVPVLSRILRFPEP